MQELFTGSKYKFKVEGDSYQLIIMNPKVEDTGKYTIDIGGVTSTAFLNVDEPDPSYTFVRTLKKKYEGFTDHEATLECSVSSNMAIVGWYKGDKKLEDGDVYSISKELSGICKLTIKNCKLKDTGDYSCRIEKQTDRTDTKLQIVGKCLCVGCHSFSQLAAHRHISTVLWSLGNCLDECCLVSSCVVSVGSATVF